MGKIRINTIGDENLEQKQKAEAEKRQEAKKVTKGHAESPLEDTEKTISAKNSGELKKKIQKKAQSKSKNRSPRYVANKKHIDRTKQYKIVDALEVLSQMSKTKFDETVELHINTVETSVSGNVMLPHGTGKKTRVVVISPSKDAKAAEDLIKRIEAGRIEFDVLIATPEAMPKLAKVARILGPKGLMPNPKTGTVTAKPEELAKKYEDGQIAYKTEAKSPIIHVPVGKMSFGKEKLTQNIEMFLGSVDRTKMKTVFVKSTMSPSLKLIL